MNRFLPCTCPYCGEPIELPVDPSAGAQDTIEDCPVCCRPIQVRIDVAADGEAVLSAAREDQA
jgi:hypothetical protein